MSDRVCVRGCTRRGVHYAECDRNGPSYEGDDPCTGCAPVECRDGSLICDRCFGRMRGLLADIFDLIGRLRSLADPSKATPTDEERFASNYRGSKAPAGVDLLDALHAVEAVAGAWEAWGLDMRRIQNDLRAVEYFGGHVLDRHPPVDGLRTAWSVQDAVDRWGVERRDKNRHPFEDVDEGAELATFPIREWDDPMITRSQAEEVAGSARTLRRWVQKDLIGPAGTIWIAGDRTTMWRRNDVLRLRDEMRRRVGRPKNA